MSSEISWQYTTLASKTQNTFKNITGIIDAHFYFAV